MTAASSLAIAQLGAAPLPQLEASKASSVPPLEAIQAWLTGKYAEVGTFPKAGSRGSKYEQVRLSFAGCTMKVTEIEISLTNATPPDYILRSVLRKLVPLASLDFDSAIDFPESEGLGQYIRTVGDQELIWTAGHARDGQRAASVQALAARFDSFVSEAEAAVPDGTKGVGGGSGTYSYVFTLFYPSQDVKGRVLTALRDMSRICRDRAAAENRATGRKPGELY